MLPLLAAQAADGLYQASMGALTNAINGLKDRFDKAMQLADTTQRSTLALGKTLEEAKKDLGGSLKGLRGSLEGQFGVGLQLLRAGLDKNSAGIGRLINQQMLTGTAFTNTAKTFAKLEGALGLSKEASNELADNIILLGYKYGISTDKLIDTITSLRSTLGTQKLLGLGAEFQAAVARLQGEVGPAFAEEVSNAITYILEPSFERTAQLNFAGLGGIREELKNNSKDSEALYQSLVKAIVTTASVYEGVTGGKIELIGNTASLLGAGAQSLFILADAFGRRNVKEIEREKALSQFADTIETMRAEAFAPLEQLLIKQVYPAFKQLYEIVYGHINVFFKAFGVFVNQDFFKDKNIIDSEIFKKLKNSLFDALEGVGKFTFKIATFLTDGGLDLLKQVVLTIVETLDSIFKPGGAFDGMRASLLGFPASLLRGLDTLPFVDIDPDILKKAERLEFTEDVRLRALRGELTKPISGFRPLSYADPRSVTGVYTQTPYDYALQQATRLGIEDGFEKFVESFKQDPNKPGLAKQVADLWAASSKGEETYITFLKAMRENMGKSLSLLYGIDESSGDTADSTAATERNTRSKVTLDTNFLGSATQRLISIVEMTTAGITDAQLEVLEDIAESSNMTAEQIKRLINRSQSADRALTGN